METTGQKTLRLAQITDDHPPERLIEIIQNKSGDVPKEEREAALIVLIRRFQYLIRKVCNSLYFQYNLEKKYGYAHEDFQQDVLTEFLFLVTQDFKIKDDDKDTGFAVFGSYIKVKLYRRCQYKMQEWTKKTGYAATTSVDYTQTSEWTHQGTPTDHRSNSGAIDAEVREAIVANALHYDDMVLNHMQQEEIGVILQEIIAISRDILNDRDRLVWELYYLSGLMVGEIGQHIPSKVGEKQTIGRSRVLQIAREANDRIIREYGRRSVLRRSGL